MFEAELLMQPLFSVYVVTCFNSLGGSEIANFTMFTDLGKRHVCEKT